MENPTGDDVKGDVAGPARWRPSWLITGVGIFGILVLTGVITFDRADSQRPGKTTQVVHNAARNMPDVTLAVTGNSLSIQVSLSPSDRIDALNITSCKVDGREVLKEQASLRVVEPSRPQQVKFDAAIPSDAAPHHVELTYSEVWSDGFEQSNLKLERTVAAK